MDMLGNTLLVLKMFLADFDMVCVTPTGYVSLASVLQASLQWQKFSFQKAYRQACYIFVWEKKNSNYLPSG